MTTLLTGATGFVGSAVLRVLLKAGHKVRVLVRENNDRRNLEGLGCEIWEGNLNEKETIVAAIKGCKHLFHVAADYRLWTPVPKQIYQTNVTGTQQLMAAALEAGIERVVYTSSVAVLKLNADGTPSDEDSHAQLEDMIGHYKRSKFMAEKAVYTLIKQGLPAVIVNPSTPVGPRDIKPTPTGKIILDTMLGKMPAYVDTGLNIVHVDDVAIGHLLAFEKGVVGERYILGGENLKLKEILEIICAQINTSPPKIQLPHNLILPIAWAMENLSKFTKLEPRVTLDGVRMAKKSMFFSSRKAIEQLGYQPRPSKDGIIDAINWFNACMMGN